MCECVRLVAEMNSNMNLSTIGEKRVRETIWLAWDEQKLPEILLVLTILCVCVLVYSESNLMNSSPRKLYNFYLVGFLPILY